MNFNKITNVARDSVELALANPFYLEDFTSNTGPKHPFDTHSPVRSGFYKHHNRAKETLGGIYKKETVSRDAPIIVILNPEQKAIGLVNPRVSRSHGKHSATATTAPVDMLSSSTSLSNKSTSKAKSVGRSLEKSTYLCVPRRSSRAPRPSRKETNKENDPVIVTSSKKTYLPTLEKRRRRQATFFSIPWDEVVSLKAWDTANKNGEKEEHCGQHGSRVETNRGFHF